ncbi:MAG: alpha/beta hydrolase [Planctomycetes bacterium]|nr:alpha/beta hydrolase [Planctomycetota bacterium]
MRKMALEGFGEAAAVRRFGEEGDGAGWPSPIVLLPGTSCDGGVYALLGPRLPGREVLALDWPHDHPRFAAGMDGFADLLWEMLGAARIRTPIILGGNSFGAMLALHAALRRPDDVAAIVLLAGCAAGAEIYRTLKITHKLLRPLPPRLFDPFLRVRHLFGSGRGVARRLIMLGHFPVGPFAGIPEDGWPIIAGHIGVWPLAMVRTVVDAFMAWDVRDRLSDVRAPALVIHGTKDRLIPFAAGEGLGRGLPAATFVAMPGIGHAPMIMRPAETAGAILSFFDVTRSA